MIWFKYLRTKVSLKAMSHIGLIQFSALFLSLCFFHSGNCSVLEEIEREHRARYQKFDLDRKDVLLASHTATISDLFSDPSRINYTRQATEEEKKRAFKAMMGSVVVHNGTIHPLYNRKPFNNPLYEDHYRRQLEAIDAIDTAIRVLWGKFNRWESHRLQDIIQAMASTSHAHRFNYNRLLTTHFVEWFYETLEEHLPEQNFFAGTATREWFEKASDLYIKKKVKEFTRNKFEMIFENESEPIALYKHFVNQREGGRNRQVKPEFISWLIAKEARLTDVINPVLPVRKTAKGFVIDPVNYDGSLEPIAGLILKNDKKALDKYGVLKGLLSGMLGACEAAEEREKLGYYYNCFGINKTKLYSPWLIHYSKYFDNPNARVNKHGTPFIDFLRGTNSNNRLNDLRVFRDSISVKHLLDIVVFWYLTMQEDINPSNIVYVPNQHGRIIPIIIDYDLAFRKNKDEIKERIPAVYMLPHATQSLPTELLDGLTLLSERRITRIVETYKNPSPHDFFSEFTVDDSLALEQRLRALKDLARQRPASTLKEMMLDLIKIQGYSLENWLLAKACRSVGTTILEPITFFRDMPVISPYERYLGQISLKNCSKHLHVSILPWVFEVNDREQLEADNEGYIVFRDIIEIYDNFLGYI